MVELLEPKLKDRSGAGAQDTLVAGSFRRPAAGPYVKTFEVELVEPNLFLVWTTDDANEPVGLTGFYAYTNADGAGWVITGTFDANERASSMGSPAFDATLEIYLLAHNSAGQQLSAPSVPVLFSRTSQMLEAAGGIDSSVAFPDVSGAFMPGAEALPL